MIKKSYNEEIVATIRNSLPANEKIASFLSDLFFWSKEAIYRRLRGEIAFTCEEIIIMAAKLDFSIDNIVRFSQSERVIFDLSFQQSDNATDLYCEKRGQLIAISQEIYKSAGSESLFAINYIPFSFSMYFEMLSKFDYYKWKHQINSFKPDTKMCDIIVPQKIREMRDVWIKQERSNSTVSYILDNNVFLSLIRDVDYFYKRKLINEDELEAIKQDLLYLVDILIDLAQTGTAVTGAKVLLYLSPIDIISNHFYIEYDDSVCCYVQIYGIDVLTSYYPDAFQAQKEWIENYKKYSILITQSAEMERFCYFEKQREHILNMGHNK